MEVSGPSVRQPHTLALSWLGAAEEAQRFVQSSPLGRERERERFGPFSMPRSGSEAAPTPPHVQGPNLPGHKCNAIGIEHWK